MATALVLISFALAASAYADTNLAAPVRWTRDEQVPAGGRPNPFALSASELEKTIVQGKTHALVYPVEITGALLPYRAVKRFLNSPSANPLRALLQSVSKATTNIKSFDEALMWLGLKRYPVDAGSASSPIPLPTGVKPGDRMGLSLINSKHGVGFTFSCAGCHAGELFGRPVLGLTNRFPRANAFFIRGKTMTELAPTAFFSYFTNASKGDSALYERTRANMRFVESKRPEVLGLDTSLAHVALSLARRERDAFATKDINKAYHPDYEPLATTPSDSKPMPWWNVKYKNRFLADGSVVSGNPIITNILWNEIGRGTDLHELSAWLDRNQAKLQELTTAVFSNEAPHITEFFPAEKIDLLRAKHGQVLFAKYCSRCHGNYEKAWDSADASSLAPAELLKTTLVRYPEQTRVEDVGTDPLRYQAMKSLLALNDLAISKQYGVQIETQEGYVPPPLVGIWARWPYFHNNSAPSLCAVLSPQAQRPAKYWAGEPVDRDRDFDFDCNGYPIGAKTPSAWKKNREFRYDTSRDGLSNSGHDEDIFVRDGKNILSASDRGDLIQFLQTL